MSRLMVGKNANPGYGFTMLYLWQYFFSTVRRGGRRFFLSLLGGKTFTGTVKRNGRFRVAAINGVFNRTIEQYELWAVVRKQSKKVGDQQFLPWWEKVFFDMKTGRFVKRRTEPVAFRVGGRYAGEEFKYRPEAGLNFNQGVKQVIPPK